MNCDKMTVSEWLAFLIRLAEESLPEHEKESLRYMRTFGLTSEQKIRIEEACSQKSNKTCQGLRDR